VVTYTATGTELTTAPLEYVCTATALAPDHSISDTATSSAGYILTKTPSAALSVAADGVSLTATFTNIDETEVAIESVSSSNITGLITSGTIGALTNITDACTATPGLAPSFSFIADSTGNKYDSARSNTASLSVSATPTTNIDGPFTNKVRFSIYSASAGTVYYNIRSGSTNGTIVVDGSSGTAITADGTVLADYNTQAATTYYLTDVYFVESGKVRSAAGTVRTAQIITMAPSVSYNQTLSDSNNVAFTLTQNDTVSCSINWEIRE